MKFSCADHQRLLDEMNRCADLYAVAVRAMADQVGNASPNGYVEMRLDIMNKRKSFETACEIFHAHKDEHGC